MIDNYQTIYYNLPTRVKGLVVYDSYDDYYTIVLNARLSHDENVKTFWHELKHITFDDFHSKLTATQLEAIRH